MTKTHTYRPPINNKPTNSIIYRHKQQFYNSIMFLVKKRIII